MKRCVLLAICLMICCACTKDQEGPVIELVKSRIQIGVDSEIDYLSFVQKAIDEVDGDLISEITYNQIETSEVGQYEVVYKLSDHAGNQTEKKLIIDVVHYFDNGVFSPVGVVAETVENPEDITVLVNKLYAIPEGWVPDDLESVIDNSQQMLRKEANEAYTQFYLAAKEKGIDIYSISGYRTNETQTTYWTNMVKVYGEEYASQYSAYPGRSEHQLGLAIDVSYKTTGDRLSESVADSEIGQFIVTDAYKYGFILRYPKDKVAITNYGYEPWHIRYVGVELASELYQKGLTLEEYYDMEESDEDSEVL